MCGCGINETCYGCKCGCDHSPKLQEALKVSEQRRVNWLECKDAILRVDVLHSPEETVRYGTICSVCEKDDFPMPYPCPTKLLLDGEQG